MDLLERGAVVDRIATLAAAAYDGRGRVVCVVAPAGVGKTSVLGVAAEAAAAAGMRVVGASGSEQERSIPYGVIRSLLAALLADPLLPNDVLTGAAAPVLALLAGEAPAGPVHHAVYWTIANLARLGPLALVVDDAHWSDDASLDALAYVARRLGDLPVLLLAAVRPSGQAGWHPALESMRAAAGEIRLEPLSEDAVAALLRRTLGQPVAAGFSAACHRATGGVPFYLAELAHDLLRRAIVPSDGSVASVEGIAPEAIVRSVLLRLSGLGAVAPLLAKAVAVLGDGGDGARLDHAATLAGADLDAAALAADALIRGGILADAGTGLRFAHPILRTAVTGDIGPHELARWHRRAADVLDAAGAGAPVVAAHLLRTEPSADSRVAGTLLEAARAALSAGSPATATELLRRAQAEPPPASEQAAHLYTLGLAEAAIGDLAALEHLRASIEGATPAERAERALVLGELARKGGPVEVGIAALDAALDVLDPTSSEAALASIDRYWIGRTTLPTLARVRADRPVLDRAFAHDDPAVRRRAACYLAMEASLDGTREEVDRYLEVALAPPGLATCVEPDSGVVTATLITLTMLERYDAFDRLADDVLAVAGRTGNGVAYALTGLWHAVGLLRRGRLADADAEALAVTDFASERGWHGGTPELVAVHVLACLGQGHSDAAEQALAASPFGLAVVDVAPLALLLDARGQVALAQGRPADALADARHSGEVLEALGLVHPGYAAWRSTASAALHQLGDVVGARRLAEEQVDVADARAGPAARALALRTLAATVDRAEALEILSRAADLVAAGPALGERAQVAVALGATLRRLGRLGEARQELRTALDLATRCSAEPLARRSREELLIAGGRPRRTRVTGPDALTASERRVAQLAAQGLTNTVIAQTLFVSRKTVEKHLAGAYGKLEITSRSQLTGIPLG